MKLRSEVFRAILAFYLIVLVTLRNFENQDLFILSVIITIFSFLCMVQITLADLNYQNDIRESCESAEKRTKKQIYLRAIFPDDLFLQNYFFFLFENYLFFSVFDIFRILIDVSDPASPSVSIRVRPWDPSSSHFSHFDTFCINTFITFKNQHYHHISYTLTLIVINTVVTIITFNYQRSSLSSLSIINDQHYQHIFHTLTLIVINTFITVITFNYQRSTLSSHFS